LAQFTRKSVEEKIKSLSKDDLVGVLKFLRNDKTQSNESEVSLKNKLPEQKSTGSFNKITNLILVNVRI